jgi:hypothetical protein
MKIEQTLSLDDYHLFLKESIFENSLYKMMRVVGFVMFALILYKFVTNDFTYEASMNALLGIAVLVFNLRYITFYSERRKLNKSSYIDQLLEPHVIEFFPDYVLITKGDDIFEFKREQLQAVKDYPSLLVLEINEISNFPIPKRLHTDNDLKFIQTYLA